MTPITPADRKAYIALNMVSPQDQAAILSGDFDQAHGMQVLARHRVEAVEEAAKVAENFAAAMNAMRGHPDPLPIDTNEGWRRVMDGALDIATATRGLKGE